MERITLETKSKVDDLDLQVFVEKYVLGLDVAMGHSSFVHIGHTLQHLSEDLSRLSFLQVPFLLISQILVH